MKSYLINQTWEAKLNYHYNINCLYMQFSFNIHIYPANANILIATQDKKPNHFSEPYQLIHVCTSVCTIFYKLLTALWFFVVQFLLLQSYCIMTVMGPCLVNNSCLIKIQRNYRYWNPLGCNEILLFIIKRFIVSNAKGLTKSFACETYIFF